MAEQSELLLVEIVEGRGLYCEDVIREWYCPPPPPGVRFVVEHAEWIDEIDPETVTVERIYRVRVPQAAEPAGQRRARRLARSDRRRP